MLVSRPGARSATIGALLLLLFSGAGIAQETRPEGGAPQSKPTNDPAAVAVIDRFLESIGGKEALQAIQDKTVRFVNKKYTPTGVTEMRMARFMKRPLQIREEWWIDNMGLGPKDQPLHFVQTYDGNQGWVKAMGHVSELGGKTLTVFVWDKFLDEALLHWEQDGYTVKHKGEASVGGESADIVSTTSYTGTQEMSYYFSKSSGLLLKKSWREPAPQGGMLEKEIIFTEYLSIPLKNDREKKIKFATNQKIFEDGELNLERVYSEIQFNTGLKDNIFGRPEGPSFEDRPRPGNAPGEKPEPKPESRPKKPKE